MEQINQLQTSPKPGDLINIQYNGETGMVESWSIGSESEFMFQIPYDPGSVLFTRTFYCQVVNEEIIFRQDLYDADIAAAALRVKKEEAQAVIAYATPLINRHRDEIELGDPTTLTTEEYRALLRQRNEAVTFLNNNPV